VRKEEVKQSNASKSKMNLDEDFAGINEKEFKNKFDEIKNFVTQTLQKQDLRISSVSDTFSSYFSTLQSDFVECKQKINSNQKENEFNLNEMK